MTTNSITNHYGGEGMVERVLSALSDEGMDLANLDWKNLTSFDQFHTRGLPATREQARLAAPAAGANVVDLGCGVGGPARCLVAEYGCHVTGIDLTPEYIKLAELLGAGCQMSAQLLFKVADALKTPFKNEVFDLAWSQNVSMNVEDKHKFYGETERILKPGGRLITSDIVAGSCTEIQWPLPWARETSISFVAAEEDMRDAMESVGFRIIEWRDTTEEAVSVFQQPNQKQRRGKLGVGLIAGPDFPERSANLANGLAAGVFKSVLILAEKVPQS